MDTTSVAVPKGAKIVPIASKPVFAGLVVPPPARHEPSARPPRLSGPAHLSPIAPEKGPANAAMPADDDFLVVDDVTTVTTETGEQVSVISGEAVEGADAAVANAAAKGGKAIINLSETRLLSRSVSGSAFASMLLDQRSGILPNPFSLWRLPDQYSAASTAQDPESSTLGERAATRPGEDGLSISKELSRVEASITQRGRGEESAKHGSTGQD